MQKHMQSIRKLFSVLLMVFVVLAGSFFVSAHNVHAQNQSQSDSCQALTSFNDVGNYINTYGTLPCNYLTKEQAKGLGWVPSECNLADVAPGMSIGGDVFTNSEGSLPSASDRIWYEADINYVYGCRNGDRILFSNDGLIYTTQDHYQTFQPWQPSN